MNAGTQIGQYRILEEIGAGGMGVVSLGEHTLLGRKAAIKTLLPRHSENREVVERFFTEARAISAIRDPGVIQIYDFGYHTDGSAYIVMELLEGESLATRMERLGRIPVLEALRITRQAASALGAAHAREIVHRDLKPENIFLVRDPEASGGERTKILDFGICKLGGSEMLTQVGMTVGTPAYMSPEQCEGADDVDGRADIYALGCVLYHMLTGQLPFDGDNVEAFLHGHLNVKPKRPSEIVADLPEVLDAFLARCLAKGRADRFQTMEQLHAAVGRVIEEIEEKLEATAPSRASGTPVPGAKQFTVVLMRDEPKPPVKAPTAKQNVMKTALATPPDYYNLAALKKMSPMGKLVRVMLVAAALAGVAMVVPMLASDNEPSAPDTAATEPAVSSMERTVQPTTPPAASTASPTPTVTPIETEATARPGDDAVKAAALPEEIKGSATVPSAERAADTKSDANKPAPPQAAKKAARQQPPRPIEIPKPAPKAEVKPETKPETKTDAPADKPADSHPAPTESHAPEAPRPTPTEDLYDTR